MISPSLNCWMVQPTSTSAQHSQHSVENAVGILQQVHSHHHLVVEVSTPLKNMRVNWDDYWDDY